MECVECGGAMVKHGEMPIVRCENYDYERFGMEIGGGPYYCPSDPYPCCEYPNDDIYS